jgi:hypothetical protein
VFGQYTQVIFRPKKSFAHFTMQRGLRTRIYPLSLSLEKISVALDPNSNIYVFSVPEKKDSVCSGVWYATKDRGAWVSVSKRTQDLVELSTLLMNKLPTPLTA